MKMALKKGYVFTESLPENQTSLDNELALKIVEILKGQSYYVAEKSLKLAKILLKMETIVGDNIYDPTTNKCD